MSDIPDRLVRLAQQFEDQHAPQNMTILMRETAAEIERLRAALHDSKETSLQLLGQVGQLSEENTRLRAEVEMMTAKVIEAEKYNGWHQQACLDNERLRAALEGLMPFAIWQLGDMMKERNPQPLTKALAEARAALAQPAQKED